jgi:hypothetical protein
MRQTDLVLLYRGGSSSSERGVEYPVVLRNTGVGTFWDIALRATHDGEETDRKIIARLGPESETDQTFLLIPARFCDQGTPGVGLRPRGHAMAEALVDDELVASVDLPGGAAEPEIDRVPRTAEEEAALLRTRPEGWEYLLFASVLRREMDALEPKFRDHELRFAPPAVGPRLVASDASSLLQSAFRESIELMENFNRLFDPAAHERAFGQPGQPGDAARLEHLASRIIDVYEALLDWGSRVRQAPLAEEFTRAAELASRFVDRPIQQFRDFVDEVVAEVDRLPAALRAESSEPVKVAVTLTLSIDDGLEQELADELRRLEEAYESGYFDE